MPNATDHADLVAFEFHSCAAARTEPPARQIEPYLVGRDGDMRRKALCDRHQRRSVRFTRGQPAQHVLILPDRSRSAQTAVPTAHTTTPSSMHGPNAMAVDHEPRRRITRMSAHSAPHANPMNVPQ